MTKAPALTHVNGCADQRIETYEVPGPRDGHARVTRCIGCNDRTVEWLTPPRPYRDPADPLAGITDVATRRALTEQTAAHLEHARREAAARARTQNRSTR